MNKRIIALRKLLKQDRLDGILISKNMNVSYLSGFKGSDSYLLITPSANIFITDPRFGEQAEKELKNFRILASKDNIFKLIAEKTKSLKLKRVGFESQWLSFWEYKRLKDLLHPIDFVPTAHAVERLRQIKDAHEIEAIRKACHITKLAFKHVKSLLKKAPTERCLSFELESFMKQKGAQGMAFEPIVASGPRSSMPHALATDRKISRNSPVLIDAGARLGGYNSDLTRVYFSGKISKSILDKYKIVLEAQKSAIARVRPGVGINQIDRAARKVIENSGYGKSFLHSLGHGIGLEIHESPAVSSRNNDILEAGMVFTVEPAIYIAGKFGIRIEDVVLVTDKGSKLISDDFDK